MHETLTIIISDHLRFGYQDPDPNRDITLVDPAFLMFLDPGFTVDNQYPDRIISTHKVAKSK
jgi:hypothetical protein